MPNVPWAMLTDKGLMVTYPGMLLSGSQRPLQKGFHFQDETGSCFQVICLEDQCGERIDESITAIDPWPENAAQASRLAIITPKELDSAYEPVAILVLVEEIDKEVMRVRWLYSVAIVRVEGSEEQEVIEHIDMDRESEALNQTTDNIKWDSAMEWPEVAEENDDRPQALYDDMEVGLDRYYRSIYWYYFLTDRYHYLRRIPHDARPFLCSCKAQWVMRGQRTKLDQVWCVD